MKKRSKKWVALFLTLCFLVSTVSISGCSIRKGSFLANSGSTNEISPTPSGSTSSSPDGPITPTDFKKQYEDAEKYTYTAPVYNVSPKEYIHEIKLGFSAKEYSEEQLKEIFNVYTDAKLENTADPVVEYDDATRTIRLKPSKWGILPVSNVPGFEEKEYSTWGNINKLYFVVNIDTKTGEKLKKPQVTVVTFTNGLQSPTVSFQILEDGRAGLTWSPVEGATKYMVCSTLYADSITHNPDGSISISEYGVDQVTSTQFIKKLAETTDTRYDELYEKEVGDSVIFMNYLAAVDADLQKGFCVIALNDEGHSLASNILKIKTLLSQLPSYCDLDLFESYTDISQIPFTTNVTMISGDRKVRHQRLIDFAPALKNAKAKAAEGSSYCSVEVPYKVKGTSFTGSFYISGTSEDIVSKIEQLQERYNKEIISTAINTPDINIPDTPPSDVPPGNPFTEPTDAPDATATPEDLQIDMPDIPVYASNSLSAYLASQMLLCKTEISLHNFPEASNRDYLVDCIYEAMYQNPLILNVSSFRYNYATNILSIQYDSMDATTMATMQQEIMEEVARITKEIIKDGMTDLEKEIAINQYICDSAVYDQEACDHAIANNMTVKDPKYLDAFSAYGVLVKKKGVCASYAAAFKLLADAAGLEAVVVTGNLNGTLSHAWNRVKIEDQWYSVDSTNNDNETIPNALFNLSDEEAASVLVEDNDYICDDQLSVYTANNSDYEYYRMNNQYYERSDIEGIAKAIKNSKGHRLFRTDYKITTEEAKEILEKALLQNNYSGNCRFQVFLGVIVLDLEE